jgi:hypothetical protein
MALFQIASYPASQNADRHHMYKVFESVKLFAPSCHDPLGRHGTDIGS